MSKCANTFRCFSFSFSFTFHQAPSTECFSFTFHSFTYILVHVVLLHRIYLYYQVKLISINK